MKDIKSPERSINLNIKKMNRGPVGNQDRFLIAMVAKNKSKMRRFLECCKEMHCNLMNMENISATNTYEYAVACEEVALTGMFVDKMLLEEFRYATYREDVVESSKYERITIREEVTPEKLRAEVFGALMRGKIGIEYEDCDDLCVGPYFRYMQDMNYRVTEIGRTLMALEKCEDSSVLAEQTLPQGCAVSEFADAEGNRYLMIQNQEYMDKDKKAFRLQLNKNYRVYRVNPHNGKQVLVKDNIDVFQVLVMPGDADLLRFQDAQEEAYIIEYIFKK